MKFSAKQIQTSLFIVALVCGVLSSLRAGAACAGADAQANQVTTSSTIVASFEKKTWDYINSDMSVNSISVTECDGKGTLQISKIAVNYNPEDYQSQIYDSSKIAAMPVTCKIDTDLDKKIVAGEHFEQYEKISTYAKECLGIEIDSLDLLPIKPLVTKTCEFNFIDAQKTKVVAKGENCQIVGPKGSYSLIPVYLDSCANTDILKSGVANVESLVTVLETDKQSDVLSQKNVQLAVNADSVGFLPVAKTTFRSPKFAMLRPSDYDLDIDFAQISLSGGLKTKVTASAKYFVQNRAECQSENCISASSYRSPMIVENDLYLAKANNINERIFLGRWYNASVVPAQWSGIDGTPGINSIGYNWNSVQLNSSFSQAEQGDSLVLVSHLVNPNRGIKSFLSAAAQYFQGMKRSRPQTSSGSRGSGGSAGFGAIQSISGVSGLDAISFQNMIPEIDFTSVVTNHASANIDAGKTWLVRFGRYCSQENSENCADLTDLGDLVTIETEIKITKLDDSKLEVQPIETLKNSALTHNSYDAKLTKSSQIKCLKNEINNNEMIRSTK